MNFKKISITLIGIFFCCSALALNLGPSEEQINQEKLDHLMTGYTVETQQGSDLVLTVTKGLKNALSALFTQAYASASFGGVSSLKIGTELRFKKVIGVGCSIARASADKNSFSYDEDNNSEDKSLTGSELNLYGDERSCYVEARIHKSLALDGSLWLGLGQSKLKLDNGDTATATPVRIAIETEPFGKLSGSQRNTKIRFVLDIKKFEMDDSDLVANGHSLNVEVIF